MSDVLNVLFPGTKYGHVYAIVYFFLLTRGLLLLTHFFYLRTYAAKNAKNRVLLTPQPYNGLSHEHRGKPGLMISGEYMENPGDF